MNLHSIKMTWEENTWGRNYRVRKFRYKSSFFENTREECGVYLTMRALRRALACKLLKILQELIKMQVLQGKIAFCIAEFSVSHADFFSPRTRMLLLLTKKLCSRKTLLMILYSGFLCM